MEDFAEYLAEQAKTCGPALHEFILQYSDEGAALHLFFEGDDDPVFYMPFVRPRADGRTLFRYVAGGKPAIKAIRDYIISNGYSLDRTLFFVDRDHDDLLACQLSQDGHVFVTDYYSIESYLIGKPQAEIVLVDLAGVNPSDRDYLAFVGSVVERIGDWAGLLRPLMAFILAAREAGLRPNVKNVKLGKLFEVASFLGDIRRKSLAFHSFRASLLEEDDVVKFVDVLRWSRVLKGIDPIMWMRGKYLLWMFERAILAFIDEVARKKKLAKQKVPRIPPSLREGRLFEAMGGRIPSIPSLDDFLNRAIAS